MHVLRFSKEDVAKKEESVLHFFFIFWWVTGLSNYGFPVPDSKLNDAVDQMDDNEKI
jgi:hypothetical protein